MGKKYTDIYVVASILKLPWDRDKESVCVCADVATAEKVVREIHEYHKSLVKVHSDAEITDTNENDETRYIYFNGKYRGKFHIESTVYYETKCLIDSTNVDDYVYDI